MEDIMQKYVDRLTMALEDARRVARENRAGGSPAQSVAFDSGRVAGLQEALELLGQCGVNSS